jgi:zinc protease
MSAIEESYAMFEAEPINENDIKGYVARQESGMFNSLTSNLNVAIMLARNNAFLGKPDFMIDELNAYRNVKKEDIMRVYNQYVKGANYLTVSYLPAGREDLAVTGSTLAVIEKEDVSTQAMNSEGGTLVDDDYEHTPSMIDRHVEPGLLANTPVLPELNIWSDKLPNGLNVKGMNYSSVPLVSFAVTIKGGKLLDDINKPGVASFNAQLMNEGTALRTAEQLEEDLAVLGANVMVSSSNEFTVISGSSLLRNFNDVLKIVEEMITQPRFDEERFALRKERAIATLRQSLMNPVAVGNDVVGKILYGDQSILGYTNTGTIESITSMTIDDVKAYYAKAISPVDASFNFVGNIPQDQLMKLLASFTESWKGNSVTIPANDNTQQKYASRLIFIDFPDAPQSYITIHKTTMPMASSDFYPVTIANYGMGAGSAGELFQVLRQKYGYTYGAYSSFIGMNYQNFFMASSSVQSTATKHALELFKEIITDYPDKILDAEKLEKNRNTMLQANTRAYEMPGQLLNVLVSISNYGLPFDFVKQRENTLRNITLQQVRDVYHKWLNEDDLIYIVVGDAKRQMNGLESLGLGKPILADREGNMLSK